MSIDPRKIVVAIPCHNNWIHFHCSSGMTMCAAYGKFAANFGLLGHANIAFVRNLIAHRFLASKFEYLFCIDSDIGFDVRDFDFMIEHNAEAIINAPYARKSTDTSLPIVEFGLGFTLIHREVFSSIANLSDDDGREIVQQFMHKGELVREFYPVGANGEHRYMNEDDGFWFLVRMAGFVPHMERRCNLIHYGDHGHAIEKDAREVTFPSRPK